MKRTWTIGWTVICGLVPWVAQGQETFHERSAFEAAAGAAGGLTTLDFEDLPQGLVCPDADVDLPVPCVLSQGGVTLTTTLYELDDNFLGPTWLVWPEPARLPSGNTMGTLGVPTAPDQTYAEFTGTAFGFDVAAYGLDSVVALQFASAAHGSFQVQVVAGANGADVPFIGVAGLPDTAWRVSYFMLPNGGGVVFDNLTVARPVPEPASAALLAAGLGLGLGLGLRRRRRA